MKLNRSIDHSGIGHRRVGMMISKARGGATGGFSVAREEMGWGRRLSDRGKNCFIFFLNVV